MPNSSAVTFSFLGGKILPAQAYYSNLPNNRAVQINVQAGTFSKIIKRAYPNKSVQAGFYKILLHKKTCAGRNCHKINKRAGPNKCVQAGFFV